MPISVQNLYSTVNSCLTNAANGTLACCQLTGAQAFIRTSVPIVACTNLLPSAEANEGSLIFVSNQCRYFYSNGFEWTTCFSSIPTSQVKLIFTWGNNRFGQLGNNDTGVYARSSPGSTSGTGVNWCQASMGGFVSGAIKTDGTLWTWGRNNCGELGNNSTVGRSSPGTTSGGGTNWCNLTISGIVTTGAGIPVSSHTLALKKDGTLWSWGTNSCGQLGVGDTNFRSSPVTTCGGGTTWCQASAGTYTSISVKTDGTLWTWGRNDSGQLGDCSVINRSSPGTTAGGGTTWCQASINCRHSTALKTDGTLWTWGCNTAGALGDGTIASRSSPDTVAGGGTTWCQVTAGLSASAALKTDGTLWTWGFNNCGQLGDGTTSSRSSPGTTSVGGTSWCFVSTRGNTDPNTGFNTGHTAALKTDATLWTWGFNGTGVLANNTTQNTCNPGLVVGDVIGWCAISAGNWNSIGVINCVRGFM